MNAYSHLSSVYDTLMADIPYDQWIQYIIETLESNGINPGASVLDAGCGTGRIAIGLSRAGYRVTGLDISEEMLRMAEENARRSGAQIPFICQPITEVKLHQEVDVVTAVCDVVNYIADTELEAFFQSVSDQLNSGGMLIFDMSSPEKLKKTIGDNIFFEDMDDVTYIWTNELIENRIDMDIIMFISDAGRYIRKDEQHTQYIHEMLLIRQMLIKNSFRDIKMVDEYHNKEIEEHTQRITIIAFKE